MLQRSPPPLHFTGHRLGFCRNLGGNVSNLFSAEMSGVSGDAGAASSLPDGGAAATKNGGGEVRPSGGGKTGGELRSSLPTVTLDADAIQKFAEIELRWGEIRVPLFFLVLWIPCTIFRLLTPSLVVGQIRSHLLVAGSYPPSPQRYIRALYICHQKGSALSSLVGSRLIVRLPVLGALDMCTYIAFIFCTRYSFLFFHQRSIPENCRRKTQLNVIFLIFQQTNPGFCCGVWDARFTCVKPVLGVSTFFFLALGSFCGVWGARFTCVKPVLGLLNFFFWRLGDFLCFCFIPFTVSALVFSLPTSPNSSLFPPPPTTARALYFYREKTSTLSSLVDLSRVFHVIACFRFWLFVHSVVLRCASSSRFFYRFLALAFWGCLFPFIMVVASGLEICG